MLRLSLVVRAADADAATAAFYEVGVTTVLVEEPGDLLLSTDTPVPAGHARVVGFAPDAATAEALSALVRTRLAATLERAPFTDEDWLQKFRAHHRAVRVGRRLIVAPPWSRVAEREGRLVLRIDPGLAFGTGSHASTYLCLRALVDLARREPLGRVLDVGTGSGILAFAALRLGAESALGVEPDAEALRAARENAALNRLRRGLTLRLASAADVRGRFDLLLANLVRDLLLEHARALAARVAPGGCAVLAGILDDQAAEVQAAWEAEGLALARHYRREGWSALLFRRREPRVVS